MSKKHSRRTFLKQAALGAGALALTSYAAKNVSAQEVKIAGFDETKTKIDETRPWEKTTDRKIRVGLVGYGVCKFSTQFGIQNHPNVEIVAVSDLFSDRCAELSQAVKCEKTYPSCEELLKDDSVEAVFLATDAPSHASLAMAALNHGKHVAVAVPAVFGNVEDAEKLFETVKRTGLVYTMFETSSYRDNCYASRQIYLAGGFGKMVYTEGEYYHYFGSPIDSYNGWRIGLPPQYYPTHSNAYYNCVTGGKLVEVSCNGSKCDLAEYQPEANRYKNPFGSEVALFRTSEGGSARMAVSWDTPGFEGETGRSRGEKGAYIESFQGLPESQKLVDSIKLLKPALPPGMDAGGHGGSHGYLGLDFIQSILENRRPLIDATVALNLTVSGIVAHHSALKDGELLKIPQFCW